MGAAVVPDRHRRMSVGSRLFGLVLLLMLLCDVLAHCRGSNRSVGGGQAGEWRWVRKA
jgi:hypothetical protein